MNILNNEASNENLNAENIMNLCMDVLWEICIKPLEGQLSYKETDTIGMVGVTLQQIAQKAQCYEDMTGFNVQEKNPFEQN